MTFEAFGVVVVEQGGSLAIEPVLVDPPEAREVLVRVVANGLCHSDVWAIEHGNWGAPFPMLLGHEGAGVVEEVGPGVANVRPGDRVVLAWAVPCGTCRSCRRDQPRGCAHAWTQPPRMRRAADGGVLEGTLSIGSLATHVVVHAAQAIPVPDGVDLTRACLLGCGASTGIGASVNTAEVLPGDHVAVVGLGGIGLSALQGARLAGATRLIAVDLVPWKLEAARRMGATDVVDASERDPVAAVRELTDGEGVDVALEATGRADVVPQVVAMLGRSGRAVAIGVPAPSSEITLAWGQGPAGAAYPNKASLRITDGGDPIPAEDFPVWLDDDRAGRLDLGALISAEVPFTEEAVREGFRAMLAGEVIRTVVRISDDPATSPA